MTIVTDMGAHGLYIWPAYAAFLVIFAALIAWAWHGNAKARADLAKLESKR
jgi:heme exporter protein CcmD